MPYPYYNSYPPYYQPPVGDQLSQLRQQQYQPMQQMQTPPPQPQPANNGIIWVQGEEAAKAYMVAPGNSVLLMDSEGNTLYLKSTDAQGMPLPLRIFDYTERTGAAQKAPVPHAEDYVTRAEFEALTARLDALSAPKSAPRNGNAKEEPGNE